MPRVTSASLAARRQTRIAKNRAASKKARQEVTPSVRIREAAVAQPASEIVTESNNGVGGAPVPATQDPVPVPLSQDPAPAQAARPGPDPIPVVQPTPRRHPGVLGAQGQPPSQTRRRAWNQRKPLRQLPYPLHFSPIPLNELQGLEVPVTVQLPYQQNIPGFAQVNQLNDMTARPPAEQSYPYPPQPIGSYGIESQQYPPQALFNRGYPASTSQQQYPIQAPFNEGHPASTSQLQPLAIDFNNVPIPQFNNLGVQNPPATGMVNPRPCDFIREDDNVSMRDATPVPGIEAHRVLRIAGSMREVFTALDGLRGALEDAFGRF